MDLMDMLMDDNGKGLLEDIFMHMDSLVAIEDDSLFDSVVCMLFDTRSSVRKEYDPAEHAKLVAEMVAEVNSELGRME